MTHFSLKMLALYALTLLQAVDAGLVLARAPQPPICGTQIVADFEDINVLDFDGIEVPTVDIPRPYKELTYTSFWVLGFTKEIFYEGAVAAVTQPSISTTATSVVKSFDLKSLKFVCLADQDVQGTGVFAPTPCTVRLTTLKSDGTRESRDCVNRSVPLGPPSEFDFVTCNLDGLNDVVKVDFENTEARLILNKLRITTFFDDITYVANC